MRREEILPETGIEPATFALRVPELDIPRNLGSLVYKHFVGNLSLLRRQLLALLSQFCPTGG